LTPVKAVMAGSCTGRQPTDLTLAGSSTSSPPLRTVPVELTGDGTSLVWLLWHLYGNASWASRIPRYVDTRRRGPSTGRVDVVNRRSRTGRVSHVVSLQARLSGSATIRVQGKWQRLLGISLCRRGASRWYGNQRD
jgi:hypothetical protein